MGWSTLRAALDRFGDPIDPEVGYARGLTPRFGEDLALVRAKYEKLGGGSSSISWASQAASQ